MSITKESCEPQRNPIDRRRVEELTVEKLTHTSGERLILIETCSGEDAATLSSFMKDTRNIVRKNALARLKNEPYDSTISGRIPMIVVIGDEITLSTETRVTLDDAQIIVMNKDRWTQTEKEIYNTGRLVWAPTN